MMQLPEMVKILGISLTISLFLGILYGTCWLNQRENKPYFWFGMLFLFNALYAWVRIEQFSGPEAGQIMVLSKLIFSLLTLMGWFAYEFVRTIKQQKPTRRDRTILTAVFGIELILLWSSSLILTDIPFQRTLVTGEQFIGVATGPLFLAVCGLLLVFLLFLAVSVYQSPVIARSERRLLSLGYVLILAIGLNDAFFTYFNIPMIRLFDMALWPIGFLFTYSQFSRYSKWHETLERLVNEKTRRLVDANTQLSISEKRYRDLFEKGSDWIFVHDMTGQHKNSLWNLPGSPPYPCRSVPNSSSNLKPVYQCHPCHEQGWRRPQD
jgi:PAS domain-containing protein